MFNGVGVFFLKKLLDFYYFDRKGVYVEAEFCNRNSSQPIISLSE